ncbi:MAG: hypothetical protein JO042_14735 [Sinobacteraceae bacterium]|nr:hypothetical protein [Nevskiaceae bacterium]
MVTANELVQRAEGLMPALRARAHDAEEMGRLHDATVQDFIDTELLKTMAPKRFGGLQYSWDTGAKIVEAVACGDGSAGWVLNAYLCSTWVASLFPIAAQEQVFGARGYMVAPCPTNPLLGKARKVDGGYRVTLRAPFGSGVYHSEWAVLCATVDKKDDPTLPVSIIMLLPRADYSFDLSSWAVLGMRATASATIVVEDIFVPDHRAIDMEFLSNGNAPGAIVHGAAVYRVPWAPAFFFYTAAALTGMARNGVDSLQECLQSAVFAATGRRRSEHVPSQMRMGSAAAPADAASALLHSDVSACLAAVEDGTLDVRRRTRYRLHAAYAGLLCRQSISVVKDTAGANALRKGSAIQRIFRDIQMASGNFAFNLDVAEELYGCERLGKSVPQELV